MTRPTEPGILHPSVAHQRFDYQIHQPVERLEPFVENFWTITWDLPLDEPYVAQVLPYPSVNLSVTNSEADVTGVTTTRYDRHLTGAGFVVGARFKPGGFRPFIQGSVAELTDTHLPISQVLQRDTTALEVAVRQNADRAGQVSLLTEFLLHHLPEPDPRSVAIAALVDRISGDRQLTRVTQVADVAGVSVRKLQRLFSEYVGAGPKWVIQRCRLQDAAVRAATGETNWGQTALDLGFADQAHLTRAFSGTIGTPPATYAKQER